MPSHHDEDDMNDVMSSILHGQQPASRPQAAPINPKQSRRRSQDPTFAGPKPSVFDAQSSHTAVNAKKPRRKSKLKKPFISFLVTLLILGAATALVYAFRQPLKDKVSDFLAPPSPFSSAVVKRAGFPLYYPTKLPEGYKIETDSISQPEGDVILYAMTTDTGKRVNVTLQKQPEGVNLDPLYKLLTDIKEVDTKFGKIKIGNSTENTTIANILTGKTWVIINTTKGTVSNDQLVTLINSLREAKP